MASFAAGMSSHADIFLKVDGIEGESKDSKHSNELQILNFAFGATQPGSAGHGTGSGVGKVQMHDFTFSKFVDKSSPKLQLACWSGQHIPKVVLTCRKAGTDQQEYLKVTLQEAIISSYQASGSGGDAVPTENVSINFTKFEIEYKPQDEKGSLGGVIKSGWDLSKNVKI